LSSVSSDAPTIASRNATAKTANTPPVPMRSCRGSVTSGARIDAIRPNAVALPAPVARTRVG
jgi:hypothetical protein